MKSLFNPDNRFMQILARATDLMVLSFITLLLCVPVVTFGPAVTALFKTVYALTLDSCGAVVPTYFRAFRDNFKQTFAVGIITLVVLVSFVCDFILIQQHLTGGAYTVLLGLALVLLVLVLGLAAYLFPLIARYNNTLPEHLRNAAVLMVMHFPKTILMVFIHLVPVLIALYFTEFMLRSLLLWTFLGPGLIAQADSCILKPVFEALEKRAGEER